MSACEDCLRRAWLLQRLTGHLEQARGRIDEILGLSDEELIAAVGGRRRRAIMREFEAVVPACAPAAGVRVVCRHDAAYPERLRALASPPAVLYVIGGLEWVNRDPVAIVGARNATGYGLDLAQALGRALAGAGVPVVSGMAPGIDSGAHAGALAAPAGTTVAVLPGPAERPYPAGRTGLYRQIVAKGAVVSELPPGAEIRRWSFPARNRIIAGLASMTVVVEAGTRSGALVTAAHARSLGRPVGAVPGRVTTPQAAGSNRLLAEEGAAVIRDAQDVLDRLFGPGMVSVSPAPRPRLDPEAQAVLAAIAHGHDSTTALARAGVPPERGFALLASLELDGYVTRGPGGRYRILP